MSQAQLGGNRCFDLEASDLAEALEALDDGIALFTAQHRLTYHNERFAETFEEAGGQLAPGMSWQSFYAGAAIGSRAQGLEQVDAAIKAGLTRPIAVEAHRPGERVVRIRVHPTRAGGFVVTETDITDQRAAEELRAEADSLLRDVLDACATSIFMSRISDGAMLYQTPESVRLFGQVSDARTTYVDLKDRARYLAELLPTGSLDDYQVRLRDRTGRIFPANVSGRLVQYRGEDVIISSIQDHSLIHAQREEIEKLNQRLLDAIESLSEGFVLYDRDNRLVMANRLFRDVNAQIAHLLTPGTSHADIVAKAQEIDLIPSISDLRERFTEEISSGRWNHQRQTEIKHQNGNYYLVSVAPTDEGGAVLTWRDITERKLAEEARREADELVRTIVASSPTTFLVSRIGDGEIVYISPQSRRRFGDIKSTLEFFLDPRDRERYLAALLPTGRVDNYRVRFRRRDGSIMDGLTSARVVDYKGEALIVSSTRDISEQLRMEAELARQTEIAHQNEKLSALGELLAGVAHELNNPLSVIIGQALMLREDVTEPQVLQRIDRLANAADRSAKIVRTFLAMARQKPTTLAAVALNTIVETALDVVHLTLDEKGIALVTDLASDAPRVRADEDQVTQVIINLLVNAEHTLRGRTDGKIIVSSRTERDTGRGVVLVEDNGPGVPDDLKKRIFEPFFTTKEVGDGTGVGLALSHRIISSHRGTIAVDDAPGGGAVFSVMLPLIDGVTRKGRS